MKVVSIHQPNYIPWLGYFHKISKADVFVFHDDVQYSKRGMHNFHYIKSEEGRTRLKIPVEEKHGYKINEVRTKDELGWKAKHLKVIEISYKKAEFFDEVYSDLSMLINREYPNIAVMNQTIITFICNKFNMNTLLATASDMCLSSKKEEKVIEIVEELEGEIYYSGTGARVYQKEENFRNRGIVLEYSDFRPFEYQQLWGAFESNVSIIDYLMNCGYEWENVTEAQKSK